MLPPPHDDVLALVDAGDAALAAGELDVAEQYYDRAAELEAIVLSKIPRAKERTYAVVGVSVASLYYRAAQYERAEKIARELLSDDDLLPSARAELTELLAAVPQLAVVAMGGGLITMPTRGPSNPPRLRVIQQLEHIEARASRERFLEQEYIKHRTLLMNVATEKFKIPSTDAEALVQEVFASLAVNESEIVDPKAWLVAATCNASRHYWRAAGRTEETPHGRIETYDPSIHPEPVEVPDYELRLTIQETLRYLAPRCRDVILGHYFEGRSANDLAARMGTTPRYMEKLIHNCLKRTREIYLSLSKKNAT